MPRSMRLLISTDDDDERETQATWAIDVPTNVHQVAIAKKSAIKPRGARSMYAITLMRAKFRDTSCWLEAAWLDFRQSRPRSVRHGQRMRSLRPRRGLLRPVLQPQANIGHDSGSVKEVTEDSRRTVLVVPPPVSDGWGGWFDMST